jgi:SAM-dependent methyltransferase
LSEDEDRGALDARREQWEIMWTKAAVRRSRRPLPAQVRRAWEEGWFPRAARLLEVGCGKGNTARWLARNGYRVTAIDFSCSAIEMARRAQPRKSRLRFAEHDICSGPPPGGPFGALLDWGCLQGVPYVGKEAYARNLAAVSEDDARLLLFHHAPAGAGASVMNAVEELLAVEFELVEAAECAEVWTNKLRPGVALRFRRRRS